MSSGRQNRRRHIRIAAVTRIQPQASISHLAVKPQQKGPGAHQSTRTHMKKNNPAQSAFFNPRVLAAVLLCSIAASLGLFSFAATPPNGTLTDTSGPLSYTAGPFYLPNTFGNSIAGECDPDPSDPLTPCDVYRLHVSLPPGWVQAHPDQHLFVKVEWSVPAAIFDLYLWDARSWDGV